MPGFGPGLQMSVIALDELGINPINIAPVGMRDDINKIVFPFGEPDLKQGVIEAFILPGNWRSITSRSSWNKKNHTQLLLHQL
jgi:hypothetical protein